jgi:hypothetical protein
MEEKRIETYEPPVAEDIEASDGPVATGPGVDQGTDDN